MSQTGIIAWSTTAATNASADSAVNFAEGMAPSAVNDSARGLMASGAKYHKDIAGTITTAGTSTAYTATSNQVWAALTDGYTITLQMSATNGAAPTLAVDSLTAKPIQYLSGTAVGTGVLKSGGIYTFVYRSGADAFVIHGASNQEFGSGTAIIFYQDSAPTGWTIVTSSTDDRALRIVSGSGAGGGTGGALAGTTAFTTVMAARTIALANLPDHNVTITDAGHAHDVKYSGASFQTGATGAVTNISSGGPSTGTSAAITATTGITAAFGSTARGGSQTAMDFAVKYASCIIATKN